MKKLSDKEVQFLSFPDCEVELIEFDQYNKTLHIHVEGAWLDVGQGKSLGKGYLKFSNWDQLVLSEFDPKQSQWKSIQISNLDPIEEICEFNVMSNTFSLSGFGKNTGHWNKWEIQKPTIHAEFIE